MESVARQRPLAVCNDSSARRQGRRGGGGEPAEQAKYRVAARNAKGEGLPGGMCPGGASCEKGTGCSL